MILIAFIDSIPYWQGLGSEKAAGVALVSRAQHCPISEQSSSLLQRDLPLPELEPLAMLGVLCDEVEEREILQCSRSISKVYCEQEMSLGGNCCCRNSGQT